MEASFVFKKFDVEVVSSIFKKYPLTKGIFSTVIDKDDELVEYLGSNLRNFVFLDETVSLPIKVQYKTPKTLGKDRLAAAVGANYLQPEKDLLVIDAGTAITYELIDASGSYLGGNISPGMTTRFRALNLFTEKLPFSQANESFCTPSVILLWKIWINSGKRPMLCGESSKIFPLSCWVNW